MPTPQLYPLTFIPQLRDYVWGGRSLESLYNRKLPPGITAESWEISGHPEAATVVAAGPLTGQTLPQLLARYGEALVGKNGAWALERGVFPLLVKLLDANQNLSVQVHPNDDYAAVHEAGSLGKTEMWYVLHAEPEAKIIYGLKSGVTRESFQQAIEGGSVETQLHSLSIQAGDTIFVAAGAVHALLSGAVIAEIQQTSDITYRVYDWGRMGTDGKPRALHIDKALDVIDFSLMEPGPVKPEVVSDADGVVRAEVSRCPYFVVEKVSMQTERSYHGHTDGRSMEIWGTIAGRCRLVWPGESIELPAIRFGLVPAELGAFIIETKAPSTLLRVYLP